MCCNGEGSVALIVKQICEKNTLEYYIQHAVEIC